MLIFPVFPIHFLADRWFWGTFQFILKRKSPNNRILMFCCVEITCFHIKRTFGTPSNVSPTMTTRVTAITGGPIIDSRNLQKLQSTYWSPFHWDLTEALDSTDVSRPCCTLLTYSVYSECNLPARWPTRPRELPPVTLKSYKHTHIFLHAHHTIYRVTR